MEFIFRVTQYNTDDLVNEVAIALEKQLEINSRKKLPSVWRFIDHHRSHRAPEGTIKKRSIRAKIYGIILTGYGDLSFDTGIDLSKRANDASDRWIN